MLRLLQLMLTLTMNVERHINGNCLLMFSLKMCTCIHTESFFYDNNDFPVLLIHNEVYTIVLCSAQSILLSYMSTAHLRNHELRCNVCNPCMQHIVQ